MARERKVKWFSDESYSKLSVEIIGIAGRIEIPLPESGTDLARFLTLYGTKQWIADAFASAKTTDQISLVVSERIATIRSGKLPERAPQSIDKFVEKITRLPDGERQALIEQLLKMLN